MLRNPWRLFDALKTTDPGPAFTQLPLERVSQSPSRMIISSSLTCLCGGCEVSPGFSVVTCISNWSSVAVGLLQSTRTSPVFVLTAFISFQLKTVGPRIGISFAAMATALRALGIANNPTRASRRVIIVFSPELGAALRQQVG